MSADDRTSMVVCLMYGKVLFVSFRVRVFQALRQQKVGHGNGGEHQAKCMRIENL